MLMETNLKGNIKTHRKIIRVSEVDILYNYEQSEGYYLMGFKSDQLKTAKPGQFISLSVNGTEKNMPLRRPYTIYKIKNNIVEILYKVIGKGTNLIKGFVAGDKVNLLGPLGNWFDVVENMNVMIIGRGCGLATLANLGNSLKDAGCHVTTLSSFRTKKGSFVDEYIKDFSDSYFEIYDEDDTSNLLNVSSIIKKVNPEIIYLSGSRRLIKLVKELGIRSYVSLEERMGCGLGACLTCPVMTVNGYKRVCKDGPCFDVKEVIE